MPAALASRIPLPYGTFGMPFRRRSTTCSGKCRCPGAGVEREPDLRNSAWETARFVEPADRRHSVIVFRGLPGPGRDATHMIERAETSLAANGFGAWRSATPSWAAGRPGKRPDCEKRDTGRVWAVRNYFVVDNGIGFCLGCGSSMPEEDETLFAAMARSFEISTA